MSRPAPVAAEMGVRLCSSLLSNSHCCYCDSTLARQWSTRAQRLTFTALMYVCLVCLQVIAFAPDVLLLCPCSRSTAAAMPDVTRLAQLPGFRDLPAVQSGRVYVVDHSFFSRPGPRLVGGVELLFELLWGQQGGELGFVQQHCADQAAAGVGQQDSGKQSQGVGNLPMRGRAETHAVPAAASSGCVKAASSPADTACGHEQALEDCVRADEPVGPALPCNRLPVVCAEQEPGNEHAVLGIKCLPDGTISWVPL